jgi:hypothetical protein
MVKDAAGNWGKDTMWINVHDSSAPIANAGPDIEIIEDTESTFSGNQTLDNDPTFNLTGNFTWSFVDYVKVNDTYQQKNIQLNGIDVKYIFKTPGRYSVTLTATDNAGNSDTDTLWVDVVDITAPIANAGNDRTVLEGRTVLFNSSWSSDNDPDFDLTGSYEWRFTYNNESVVLKGQEVPFKFNVSTPTSFEVVLEVKDAAGNSDLTSIKIYVLEDPLLPRVTKVYPINSAVDVALDTTISIKFDEELDQNTIFRDNSTSWLLYPDPIEVYDIHNNPVNGSIEYDPNTFTLTFIPEPGELDYNNGYTVTASSYMTDIAGNPIDGNGNSIADPVPSDDYKWVFTTVAILTEPGPSQLEVPLNTLINATFSGNTSEMTLLTSKIEVIDQNGVILPGTISFDNSSLTVTFHPAEDLKKGMVYTVTFDVDVYSLSDPSTVYTNYTTHWDFSAGSVSKSQADDEDLDNNALILWLIYIIVIVIILILIFIYFKRRIVQQEPKPARYQDEYLYEEDWSSEVREPARQKQSERESETSPEDEGIEWDDDDEEDSWKPPVVEWEDIETKPEPTPDELVPPPKKRRKSGSPKVKSKKVKPVRKSKRKNNN